MILSRAEYSLFSFLASFVKYTRTSPDPGVLSRPPPTMGSRKQASSEESKDADYLNKRARNNEAVKRSREKARQKAKVREGEKEAKRAKG